MRRPSRATVFYQRSRREGFDSNWLFIRDIRKKVNNVCVNLILMLWIPFAGKWKKLFFFDQLPFMFHVRKLSTRWCRRGKNLITFEIYIEVQIKRRRFTIDGSISKLFLKLSKVKRHILTLNIWQRCNQNILVWASHNFFLTKMSIIELNKRHLREIL